VFFWTLLARQISRYFDKHPEMRPQVSTRSVNSKQFSIELSKDQQAQIKEIFQLFDTDGGGTIDTHELSAAMVALGFQSRKPTASAGKVLDRDVSFSSRTGSVENFGDEVLEATASHDSGMPNSINLEEFTALMKGELLGRDPQEEIHATFAAFSMAQQQNNGSGRGSGCNSDCLMLPITLDMLRRTCREFDVLLTEKELVCMMEEVDTDGSGFVEEAEYVHIMSLSPWF
jgi:Ca2+-binding EF-hand superfamily protein